MIYLPKGLKNGEVVDPDKMAQDFIEANKVAQETTQYQWRKDEFSTFIDKFDTSLCKVEYASTVCKLHVTRGNEPALFGTSTTIPTHTGGTVTPTVDANLFLVPFNKGYFPVDDTKVSWTSEYPELVHITFSFQYVRDFIDRYVHHNTDDEPEPGDATYSKRHKIRLQTGIEIDGSIVPGSGPSGLNLEESPRGLGYAGRSLATTVNVIQFLPAGIHTVRAVAGTLPASKIEVDQQNANLSRFLPADVSFGLAVAHSGKSMYQDICIGTRNMIVVRYGRGKMMRG